MTSYNEKATGRQHDQALMLQPKQADPDSHIARIANTRIDQDMSRGTKSLAIKNRSLSQTDRMLPSTKLKGTNARLKETKFSLTN